jgi:hypothetical protein
MLFAVFGLARLGMFHMAFTMRGHFMTGLQTAADAKLFQVTMAKIGRNSLILCESMGTSD